MGVNQIVRSIDEGLNLAGLWISLEFRIIGRHGWESRGKRELMEWGRV